MGRLEVRRYTLARNLSTTNLALAADPFTWHHHCAYVGILCCSQRYMRFGHLRVCKSGGVSLTS